MYDASFATHLTAYAWVTVAIVWFLGAFGSKQTVRADSPGRRLSEFCFLLVGFSLLFKPQWRPGPLAWRVIPASAPFAWAGVLLTFAGIAFSIWARFLLGRNWSATVTVKRDHTLVCRGPYAIVRHPIYSGFLLAALGTAIAYGEAGCFLAPPLLAIVWRRKSRLEEEFMRSQFGDQYVRYTSRVKALIPLIW